MMRYIINNGKIFRAGLPEVLSRDPEVRRVYEAGRADPNPSITVAGLRFIDLDVLFATRLTLTDTFQRPRK